MTLSEGGASVELIEHPDCVEARNLTVSPGHEKSAVIRLGSRIAAFCEGKDLVLRVDFFNEDAIRFYLGSGFAITALVMAKSYKEQ